MSGFKLLGIRPLQGCDQKFRKNLQEGVLYKFYQDYDFYIKSADKDILLNDKTFKKNKKSEVTKVIRQKSTFDLYSGENININVSAIVGNNGSGKSSLLDLFYLAVYLIDYKNILKHKQSRDSPSLFIEKDASFNEIISKNEYLFKNGDESELRALKGVLSFKNTRAIFEVFYELDETIFRILIDTQKQDEKEWYKIDSYGDSRTELSLPIPFYSIALNYSIHSLNSIDYGIWLESIFHKNDAYQTPLVINPKRSEGTIDIENERGLQKSRLLVNTLELSDKDYTDPLFNGKKIDKIVFKFKYNNYQSKINSPIEGNFKFPFLAPPLDKTHPKTKISIEDIQKHFSIKEYDKCSWIEKEAFGYLIRKVDKTFETYKSILKNKETVDLGELSKLDSHITFKLNQAANFIKFENTIKTECEKIKPEIIKDGYGKGIKGLAFRKNPKIQINIENDNELATKIYSKSENDSEKKITFLPPPIFDYDLHFSSNDNDTFERLSSGEKQQIYSIHTLMYHLRNTSSVKDLNGIRKYRSINIVLDEIELYFHPEMQRRFIKNLIDSILKMKELLKNNIQNVNIILATHSPFILSDIHDLNVLRLENGKPSSKGFGKTFGANIHDLLANDFFLDNGFIGEFATEKINKVIHYLNFHINSKEIKILKKIKKEKFKKYETLKIEALHSENEFIKEELQNEVGEDCRPNYELIINSIGEPILTEKLREMYKLAFNIKTDA